MSPAPPPPPKFFCDAMLGGLARWLRAAGYEAEFEHGIDDGVLVARAMEMGAVVLSSDGPLFDRRPVRDGHVRALFVPRHAPVHTQAVFVLRALGLAVLPGRCMACGGALDRVERATVEAEVPPGALATHERFFRCARCRQVYWEGGHFAQITATLDAIAQQVADAPRVDPPRETQDRPRRAAPAPISPLGPGLAARRLRIARRDVVRLGALLAGYDHLVSLHDAPDGSTLLVTTPDRVAELDDVLRALRTLVPFDAEPAA